VEPNETLPAPAYGAYKERMLSCRSCRSALLWAATAVVVSPIACGRSRSAYSVSRPPSSATEQVSSTTAVDPKALAPASTRLGDEADAGAPTILDGVTGADIPCGKNACPIKTHVCCRARLRNSKAVEATYYCGRHKPRAPQTPLAGRFSSCIEDRPHGLAEQDPNSLLIVVSSCDSSQQCAEGYRCYLGPSYDGPPSAQCASSGGTSDREICRPGTCRTKGTVCDGAFSGPGGTCRPTPPRIRCGSILCSARQPYCCLQNGVARCATRSDCLAVQNSALYECTVPADCGGEMFCCAIHSLQSRCMYRCDAGVSARICRTDADCVFFTIGGSTDRRACVVANGSSYPGSLKVCE